MDPARMAGASTPILARDWTAVLDAIAVLPGWLLRRVRWGSPHPHHSRRTGCGPPRAAIASRTRGRVWRSVVEDRLLGARLAAADDPERSVGGEEAGDGVEGLRSAVIHVVRIVAEGVARGGTLSVGGRGVPKSHMSKAEPRYGYLRIRGMPQNGSRSGERPAVSAGSRSLRRRCGPSPRWPRWPPDGRRTPRR